MAKPLASPDSSSFSQDSTCFTVSLGLAQQTYRRPYHQVHEQWNNMEYKISSEGSDNDDYSQYLNEMNIVAQGRGKRL